MGICKLCCKEKKLVNSHIFPEFMYKSMYDSYHQFKVLTTEPNGIIKNPRKGIYEKLLCENCDRIILGKYDDHAAKVLVGDGTKEIFIEHSQDGYLIHNVDYKLFKLFQISLFWRASISTRPEIKRISFGPHYEKMRKMLYNGTPGEPYEYGTIIYFFQDYSKIIKNLIAVPELSEKQIEGYRTYRAIFNGLFWTIFVSNHSKRFPYKELFLSKEGVLPIINATNFGKEFIENLIRDIKNCKKFSEQSKFV